MTFSSYEVQDFFELYLPFMKVDPSFNSLSFLVVLNSLWSTWNLLLIRKPYVSNLPSQKIHLPSLKILLSFWIRFWSSFFYISYEFIYHSPSQIDLFYRYSPWLSSTSIFPFSIRLVTLISDGTITRINRVIRKRPLCTPLTSKTCLVRTLSRTKYWNTTPGRTGGRYNEG